MWRHTVTYWRGSEGETGEWSGQPVPFSLPRNMVYPALLPLMRTPRLQVADWNDAPADLNGLVRFAERRNVGFLRVCHHVSTGLYNTRRPQLISAKNGGFKNKLLHSQRPTTALYYIPYFESHLHTNCTWDIGYYLEDKQADRQTGVDAYKISIK